MSVNIKYFTNFNEDMRREGGWEVENMNRQLLN